MYTKKLFITWAIFLSVISLAQIGINQPNPSATLDVTAKVATGTTTTTEGILIPRVTRERAQNMTGVPTSTMIYINEVITGTQTGTTANVGTPGFYYFNGTAWIKTDNNVYENNGTLTGNRTVTQGASTLAFTGSATNAFSVDGTSLSIDASNHRVGVGTTAPTAKLEVDSGTAGASGLKFTNMNSSTTTTQNVAALGVDATGNVVIQNTAPLTTAFKSFNINANSAVNSLITIGSLEFRYPSTTCTDSSSFMQVRSTSGATNLGAQHATFLTAQNTSSFLNTQPVGYTTSFADIGIPLNCVNDSHAQFIFFSYTDRTFYRVNINISDTDSLGFGALGYIFVELQK
ncbi:hypothetical protein J3D55_000551 [Chryseobacterium ginsenosidimutans]|uniref:hypothetical protein n=1 Tax=Chryseobacterium ginsenosidimutans TaxID=687846 RepID=UPI0021695609|nr:hypothetical protein [Chryseobacterium ginsenosidimutans]MCS3867635.1 hypothetical protein [Chryseobacterium ginsenosidimutans]